jgi:hypothetical protein
MKTDQRGFLTLLEIIVVLAVIATLYYILMKANFVKPDSYDKALKIQGAVAVPGIDTSSPLNIKESTRQMIKSIEKQRQQQMDDVMQKDQ